MKTKWLLGGVLVGAVVMAGCSGKTQEQPAPAAPPLTSSLPAWIVTPQADDALAATGCVPASGRINSDSSRADLAARQQLAATLGAQIQSLTESYQRTVDTSEDGLSLGGNFEEVIRQVVDERLVGSRRVHADYVTIEGQRQFCSMVAVGESDVTQMLERVAEAAGVQGEVLSRAQMREQYMSQDAFNRLDRQLGR